MEQQTKYDVERLLFRRQFILGPRFAEKLESWKRIKVRNELCLTAHPDLPTYRVTFENKAITLLGYALDPNDPHADDATILHRLLRDLCACAKLDDFFKCTYELGGRWILIVDDGKEIRLFHDTVGYRQVFFTDLSLCNELWCASQPALIAEALGCQIDDEAKEFINFCKGLDKEYWWPGDSTPYRETKCLLPNNWLDLKTGLHHRFWPDAPLRFVSLTDGVEKCAGLLQGLIKSAENRFKLAMTLTAGRDTRLFLAAAREIRHKVNFCTFVYWKMTEQSPDVEISSRLLSRLGLKHQIIQCPSSMEPGFQRLYMRNVAFAHDAWGVIAQGLHHQYPPDSVCVKGNAVAIAKANYRHNYFYKLSESERGGEITTAALAKMHGIEGSSFALKAFERWLSQLGNTYNFDVLDLFQWEQKEARWQAMSQTEWDIVLEVFDPYNCRALLSHMLSIPVEYRQPPTYAMHQALTARLWPELLSEPINPHLQREPEAAKSFSLAKSLAKTRVHRLVPQRLRNLLLRAAGGVSTDKRSIPDQRIIDNAPTEQTFEGPAALPQEPDLLDLLHDTVMIRDIDGTIHYWNRAAYEMYGWTREEAVGNVSHELLQTSFPDSLEKIEGELTEKGLWEGQLVHTRRNGRPVTVNSRWVLRQDHPRRGVKIVEINQIQHYVSQRLRNLLLRLAGAGNLWDFVAGVEMSLG
jgi:PAS domain S-box-containing protein